MAEEYSMVYIYHIVFIHSLVDGHQLFPCLAIVNSATTNTGVHASFQIRDSVFPDICPGVGLKDPMVALI